MLVLVLAVAGCGSSAVAGTTSTPQAAAPMTPVERCEASVDVLLSEALTAMQHGYSNGLNMVQVEQRYGAQSAVYLAFVDSEGLMIGNVDEHGMAGAVGNMTNTVRARCQGFISQGDTP
jgi:hypothetical protein